ncbi:RNA polymerase rpb1, domain 2 domain-containing protein [Ditylenchus destructor]|nr:RNA polymerase rpb1, domain 2 domain-containing protein [Ditylenchus destructor]
MENAVTLSVPVFNPLLVNFTFNLMKGTCVHCHRFTCSTKDKTSESFLNSLGQLDNDASKSTVTLKHSIMKEYLRDILCKRKTRCPHCKRGNGTLRNDSGRAFLLDFTKKATGANKIKETKLAMKQETERKKKIVRSMEQPEVEIDEGFGEDEKKPDVKDGNVLSALNSGQTTTSVLDPILVSERMLSNQLSYVLDGKCDKLIWRGAEVREHFRILWHKEGPFLKNLFPMFEEVENGYPVDLLFCDSILVQPSKFRPIRFLKGEKFEHPITANYRNVIEADQLLTLVRIVMNKSSSSSILEATEMIEQRVQGKSLFEKLHNAYIQLQTRINCLYDQEAIKGADIKFPGLKQILEKKEGLFRMNMMDPYLDVDEIGIPELFARKLTFPEPTNFYNTPNLRELIRRGPLQHPGANFVQAHGHYSKQVLPTKPEDRQTFAQRIVSGGMQSANAQPTLVFRHLDRGDCLLMNRQPSLHKPSIMGHRARILKGQNALRMNYAPCKAYNADFDGDEMNGHFPQNRIAQTEIEEIANVGNNYLVPKDGTPILGLIQDHVVSGVLMTMRDRFFKKEDFMHLIFSAFAETTKRINVPLPAIERPEVLWSGKQVITAIVQHFIPSGCPKINLQGKSKTPLSCWKVPGHDAEPSPEMSESEVIFRNGELLCGVLDKQHYGTTQYGLIHCCYELYGQKVAADILSCFSRVFTTYLQTHGFTLGVADILVTESADKVRRGAIKQIRKCGSDVVKKAFSLPDNASSLQIKHVMATAYNNPRKDKTDVKQLDYTMKQTTAKLSDEITKACVPKGLIRCFPQNALQMMIQSGAKGSMVNSIQISCALGQIELEGQRPPLSAVGRTLPSFRCFDPSPRAGGFVDQRFLTGLNPQELFFHTMAGREGLVDTAVKTSRSGYLQRCVIKHLEGLSVRYDNTVRDHDNSVIQFRYGEDGLDVGKATFLSSKQFPFLEDNTVALRRSAVGSEVCDSDWNVVSTEKQFRRCMKWNERVKETGKLYESAFTNYCKERIADCDGEKPSKGMLVEEWNLKTDAERQEYEPRKCIRPVDVKYNPVKDLGAMPEKILEEIAQYCKKRGDDVSEDFKRALYWKGLRSLSDPGENLNTFHFAGRGEMNVTLGIPRLREILMTAGKNIATPMAEITVLDGTPQEVIEQIKNDFNPVYLKQVIKQFTLEEKITLSKSESCRNYVLKIELLKRSKRELSARHVSRKEIMRELEKRFAKSVADCIGKRYRDVLSYEQIRHK